MAFEVNSTGVAKDQDDHWFGRARAASGCVRNTSDSPTTIPGKRVTEIPHRLDHCGRVASREIEQRQPLSAVPPEWRPTAAASATVTVHAVASSSRGTSMAC